MKTLNKIQEAYQSTWLTFAHLMGTTYISQEYTHQYMGDPYYHLSGLACGIISRTLDHISTIRCIKQMDTPEFKEAGLDEIYYEKNIFLGKHPTMKQYFLRALPQDLVVYGICTAFPSAAYALLSVMPIVYSSNTAIAGMIKDDLESIVQKSQDDLPQGDL